MKLSKSKAIVAEKKPVGKTAHRGRRESPEWQEVAAAIMEQVPGTWVIYPELDGTTDAVRVGMRLRNKDAYKEGKAFAPLKDQVRVALTDQKKVDGKTVASLAIQYIPQSVKTKKPAKK